MLNATKAFDRVEYCKLENVAIANVLQFEAARANLKSISLSVPVLERFFAYTLRCDLEL